MNSKTVFIWTVTNKVCCFILIWNLFWNFLCTHNFLPIPLLDTLKFYKPVGWRRQITSVARPLSIQVLEVLYVCILVSLFYVAYSVRDYMTVSFSSQNYTTVIRTEVNSWYNSQPDNIFTMLSVRQNLTDNIFED